MRDKHLLPVAVERPVFDPDLQLAGTVDAIFLDKKKGGYVLVDWKRSPTFTTKNNFESGFSGGPVEGMKSCNLSRAILQLNLYRHLLNRMSALPVRKMIVVVIHPDLGHEKLKLRPDENLTSTVIAHRMRELAGAESAAECAAKAEAEPPKKCKGGFTFGAAEKGKVVACHAAADETGYCETHRRYLMRGGSETCQDT